MALADTIKQMKQSGYKDADIINSLQARGISSKDINDAISQLKIKEAVTENNIQGNQTNETDSTQGMQPSMMVMQSSPESTQTNLYNQQNFPVPQQYPQQYAQQTQQSYPQEQYPQQTQQDILTMEKNQQIPSSSSQQINNFPQQQNQEYPVQYPQEQYPQQTQQSYSQEQYPQQYGGGGDYNQDYSQEYNPEYPPEEGYGDETGEYGYSPEDQGYGINTETISEIANQLIEEKFMRANTEIKSLTETKIIIESKVNKIDERLQKIEAIIDQLQGSLIRKSLEQTQNLQDIKNEMQGIQSGFSKVLNPMIDNIRESYNKSYSHPQRSIQKRQQTSRNKSKPKKKK